MLAVGTERQRYDHRRFARRQSPVKVREQLPVARGLPAKAVAETAGLDRDKHQPGLSGAVPAGASSPNHEVASNPLRPAASSIVGTSGSAAERWRLVTASALSRPPLMCGMAEGRLSNITSMSPAIRLSSAGLEPVKGKCVM